MIKQLVEKFRWKKEVYRAWKRSLAFARNIETLSGHVEM